MKGEIHAERDRIGALVVLATMMIVLFGYLSWLVVRENKAVAVSTARGGSLAPTDSARVADLRGRALEISMARWEVLDVTWATFPPTSSLYVLLRKEGASGMENRTVFHLVSGESPHFGDWAKLRRGDVVGLELADQPRESVYLGSFAGPQDYLVPGSAAP